MIRLTKLVLGLQGSVSVQSCHLRMTYNPVVRVYMQYDFLPPDYDVVYDEKQIFHNWEDLCSDCDKRVDEEDIDASFAGMCASCYAEKEALAEAVK